MVLKMFSIYDRKTEIHLPPFYAHTVGDALRRATNMFQEVKDLRNYPSDFQIFEVGQFNDQDAKLEAITPHLICSGTELLNEMTKGQTNVADNSEA